MHLNEHEICICGTYKEKELKNESKKATFINDRQVNWSARVDIVSFFPNELKTFSRRNKINDDDISSTNGRLMLYHFIILLTQSVLKPKFDWIF